MPCFGKKINRNAVNKIYSMKYSLVIFSIMLMTISVMAQKTNPNYDSELATKLGADDYGMKTYVFVLLKTGSNESTDKVVRDSCFAGHMSNIERLVEEEKLIVAGPMEKNDNTYRGIFILNVTTIDEASLLLESDAAIKAKYLEPEMYVWYGSAALSEYLPASDKVWKIGF